MFLNPAVVRGRLNGKTYPVIFDTGNSLGIFIEDTQINKHHLGVLFFNEKNKNASDGFAIADSLQIGPFEFNNYPCNFISRHAEFRLFGLLPISRFRWIVMPLDLMSKFDYIEYDQIDKELRISREHPFTVDDASEWITFPFEINQKRILIKTSIEGIPATLFLDTGSDSTLELYSTFIQPLFEKRADFQKAWKRSGFTYYPYASGKTKIKRFTAKNLRMADHSIRKVAILYPKEPDLQNKFPAEGTDGTIGLNLFKKTVMVLDFKNSLMWVKKAEGSRFEDTE